MKQKAMIKYAKQRKELVEEERATIYARNKLNKQLRSIRESMYALDSVLVNQ